MLRSTSCRRPRARRPSSPTSGKASRSPCRILNRSHIKGGAMLNGNLDTFALPDVLRFIASGAVTGRVEITRDDVVGELAVDQGRFVGASLSDEEAPSTVEEALDIARRLFDGCGGAVAVDPEDGVGG